MKVIDLTGQRFGRLVVIERAENIKGKCFWKCRCDCGKQLIVSANHLRMHNTFSCGCYQKDMTSNARKKTGMSSKRIYFIWSAMKQRCFNPKYKQYADYGGRGITVCDKWKDDFQTFYDYVSQLPHFGEEGFSIDRINNDGNYEPGNVRWATKSEQNKNQRKRRKDNGVKNQRSAAS